MTIAFFCTSPLSHPPTPTLSPYTTLFRSPGQPANKTAILNANNIRFNLTPKWSVTTRMGYDFIEKELTPSQFTLRRSMRSEEHTSELQSRGHLVCRLLLEKKKNHNQMKKQ